MLDLGITASVCLAKPFDPLQTCRGKPQRNVGYSCAQKEPNSKLTIATYKTICRCLLERTVGVGRDAPIPKTDKLQLAWHRLAVLIQPVPQNWETQRSSKEVKRQVRPVKTPSGILYDNQGARHNRRVSQEEGKTGKDVGTHGYIRKQGPLAEFEY